MKVTLIRTENESGKEAVSICEAETLIARMKMETKAKYVTGLRQIIPYLINEKGHYEYIDKLPCIYPSVECGRTKEGGRKIKHYNGVVQLEVNHLAGLSEAELVKEQALLLPQTWVAFTGSSGRSVKIWVKFALPDGNLPEREQEMVLFHAHAYLMAVLCYQPVLTFPITLKEATPEQSCRMT